MTPPLDLDALARLCAEATKGQWCNEGPIITALSLPISGTVARNEVLAKIICTESKDAAFIATAREAVPALIRELREARADVQRTWEHLTKATESMREYALDVVELRNALRGLVDALDVQAFRLSSHAEDAYQSACRVLEGEK